MFSHITRRDLCTPVHLRYICIMALALVALVAYTLFAISVGSHSYPDEQAWLIALLTLGLIAALSAGAGSALCLWLDLQDESNRRRRRLDDAATLSRRWVSHGMPEE